MRTEIIISSQFSTDSVWNFTLEACIVECRIFTTIRRTLLKGVVLVTGAVSVFNICTRHIVLLDAGSVKKNNNNNLNIQTNIPLTMGARKPGLSATFRIVHLSPVLRCPCNEVFIWPTFLLSRWPVLPLLLVLRFLLHAICWPSLTVVPSCCKQARGVALWNSSNNFGLIFTRQLKLCRKSQGSCFDSLRFTSSFAVNGSDKYFWVTRTLWLHNAQQTSSGVPL